MIGALAPLDLLIEIEKRATELRGHSLADRRLPAPGKADEDEVRLSRLSRPIRAAMCER